jgi:hypothetical protein
MLYQGVINLHGNARPHTANRTCDWLQHCGWEVTGNPLPNSPSLMIGDFHLFMKHLAGEQFAIDTYVKQAVTSWPQTLYNNFFYIRTQSHLGIKVGKCFNVSCHCVKF